MADIVQGSDSWIKRRLGKATGSRIIDIVSKTKTGPSKSRGDYMTELLLERLTGEQANKFKSADMIWGTQTEPLGRRAYAFYNDADVTEVGFVDHPRIANSGASPDGLVGDDGLIEIKCRKSANHLETLITQKVPEMYLPQIQFQLSCTGRQWCDYVSFDPRMPEEMRLFVKRVERDAVFIATLESEVEKFLAELDAKVAALRARYGATEKAA